MFIACAVTESKETQRNKPETQKPGNITQQTTPPPIVVNVSPPQKTHEEIEQEAKERKDKSDVDRKLVTLTGDLANYTFGLFVATGALVLATIGLCVFGWKQSRDMKESITANTIAAAAAKKSADVAESALRETERAFVFCAKQNMIQPDKPLKDDSKYIIDVHWVNEGRTWTKGCLQHVCWCSYEMPIDDEFGFPDLCNPDPERTFIGPGGQINGGPLLIPHLDVRAALEGRRHLYIWGWCEYDDVFANTYRHRTEFCFKLVLVHAHRRNDSADGSSRSTVQFQLHHAHNGADEDCLKPIQTGSLKNPFRGT